MASTTDSEVSETGETLEIDTVLDRLGLEGKARNTAIDFFAQRGVGGLPKIDALSIVHQVADVQAGHLSPLDFEASLAGKFSLDAGQDEQKRALEALAAALAAGHPDD